MSRGHDAGHDSVGHLHGFGRDLIGTGGQLHLPVPGSSLEDRSCDIGTFRCRGLRQFVIVHGGSVKRTSIRDPSTHIRTRMRDSTYWLLAGNADYCPSGMSRYAESPVAAWIPAMYVVQMASTVSASMASLSARAAISIPGRPRRPNNSSR